MSRYEKVISRLDSWNIILSMVVYGIYLAEPDTVLVFRIYLEVFGDGIRLVVRVVAGREKPVRIEPGRGVRARREKSSADQIHEKLCSLRLYVEFVLQSQTLCWCSKSTLEYSEMEPALQCRRQSACRTQSSLKPGSGATEGVLD